MPEKKKRKGERADGLIQVMLELVPHKDGRRRRKVFYGHTRAEAIAKRDNFIRENRHELAPDSDMTVEEWARRWLREYKGGLKPTTFKWYEWAAENRIIPEIGDSVISQIRPIDIQGIYNKLNGMSASIINQVSITANQLFQTAYDNNLIASNPAARAKPPTGKRGKREPIDHEVARLIEDSWKGHRSGIWAMLILFTGLRRGELAALEWSDVDLEKEMLTVNWAYSWVSNQPIAGTTKTSAGARSIPIPKPLLEALTALRSHATGREICEPVKSDIMTLQAFRNGWDGFMRYINDVKPADMPTIRFTPHQLRHTYCTLLYEAGIDLLTAARWMGHSDVSTTMKIYTHLSQQKIEKSKGLWSEFWQARQ